MITTPDNAVTRGIKEFYGSLIGLIGYIITSTSDQSADIAIRALPLLSPMPNAIGMYYVSISTLHFGHWQALGMALSIELGLFGVSEVVLMMFDGYQKKPKAYGFPLGISVFVAVGVMLLIIYLVYRLETAHPVLAILPLFSASGAAVLAMRRWHARNQAADIDELERVHSVNVQLERTIETLNAERLIELDKLTDEYDAERFNEQERISELEQTLNELRIENAKLSERAAIQIDNTTPGTHAKKTTETDTDKRRLVVLDFYRSNPGVPYSAAADSLGLGKTTVYNDVKFWEKQGTIHVNGNGVEVKG